MKELMRELSQKPIAYYPIYSEITGRLVSGVLLSQLVYWHFIMDEQEFHKTDQEFSEELKMSIKEIRAAKTILSEQKLIEYKAKGVPAKTFYNVNIDRIIKLIISYSQNRQTSLPKLDKLDCPNQANQNSQIGQTINTETTTETTTEKDIYSRFDEIFDFWNKQSVLPTHNRFTLEKKIKKEHMDIIVNYSIQTVIESIELYVKVLESNKHFFNYKWTLWDFLKRGIDKFLPDADPLNNFLITKINKDDTRKSREERLKETERISKEVFSEQ